MSTRETQVISPQLAARRAWYSWEFAGCIIFWRVSFVVGYFLDFSVIVVV